MSIVKTPIRILLMMMVLALVACRCAYPKGNLKESSIVLDTGKAQSTAVTDTEGAGFEVESGGTTAGVIVIPGTFPAGTNVSVTPLSSVMGLKGEKLSSFFQIKAESDGISVQPSMPVFITIETKSELPDSACLVAYNEGESEGRLIESQIVRENGISYVTAEVNHFTIFGIGEDGKGVLVPPSLPHNDNPPGPAEDNDNDDSNGEWKEWRFMVNGPAERFSMAKDNEIWDFEAWLQLTAVNNTGKMSGHYFGNPKFTITGKVKKGALPTNELNLKLVGDIKAQSAGRAEFDLQPKPWKDSNITTELYPGDPQVDVGEWLDGEGAIKVWGQTSLDISLTGKGVAPDAAYDMESFDSYGKSYQCSVLVCAKGTFIEIHGLGLWKGVMVGVPKGSGAVNSQKGPGPSSGNN